MLQQTDCALTSVSGNAVVPPFIRTERESSAPDFHLSPVVVTYVGLPNSNILLGSSVSPTTQQRFNANLVISSLSQLSQVDAKWNVVEYCVYRRAANTSVWGTLSDWGQLSVNNNDKFHSMIDENVMLVSPVDTEFSESLSELRSIVSEIRRGTSLQCSPEFESLLARALTEQGPPSDIDQWAHRIAEEIRDLDD